MPITLSSASLPIFKTTLANLDHCLAKAQAHAATRKFDPNVLVGVRLAPDMLPFVAQIRIACDAAKLAVARISGLPAPKFDDSETTFEDLRERIAKTQAWLATVPEDAIDGREEVDIGIRYGRGQWGNLVAERIVGEDVLPVCAPALIKAGLKQPEDLSGQVLIHLTTQPRAWPAWLKEAGLPHISPRGHLWLDSVPAMLEAAEAGLGVTLGMSPLIKTRPGFGRKLVAPIAFEAAHTETIYLVSRTEQARDRRIAAVRRWIVDAVARVK